MRKKIYNRNKTFLDGVDAWFGVSRIVSQGSFQGEVYISK